MRVYHGTNKKNADKILQEGFQPYTQFTPFLGSAISYGGAYVFQIEREDVTDEDLGQGGWEFVWQELIPASEIIALLKYNVELLQYNPEVEIDIKRKERGANFCENCKGDGELHYPHDGHHFLPGGGRFDERDMAKNWKVEICPVCKGHGEIKE
jgi:hypothetical protein